MEIKLIKASDIYSLAKLHYKLFSSYLMINEFQAMDLLINQLKEEDLLAMGLYKEDKLVGFILGYNYQGKWLGSIYVESKYRYYTSKLVKETEKELSKMGYTCWYAEAQTKDGKRFLNKIAKNIEHNLYRKEI